MGLIKLDRAMVINRLRWRSELEAAGGDEMKWPEFSVGYLGVYATADLREVPENKLELVVNTKLSVPFACSIEPLRGSSDWHVLVAPNPQLFDYAEVSYPNLILPGGPRLRPVLHLRALRSFDIRDFADRLATIHLMG